MTAFPNLLQTALKAHFAHADASTPKGVPPNKPEYFVIHSTCGTLSEDAILDHKKKGHKGKAHKYIMKDGSIVELWPFSDRNVYATKNREEQPQIEGQNATH